MDGLVDSENSINNIDRGRNKRVEFAGDILTQHFLTYYCIECQTEFTNKHRLKQHKCQDTEHLKCYYCTKQCRSSDVLRNHMFKHSLEKLFSCDVCDSKFRTPRAVEQHKVSHTNIGRYTCSTCRMVFFKKPALLDHLKIHSEGGNTYKCNICNCIFSNVASFNNHKEVDGHQLLKCKFCSSQFKRSYTLKTHLLIHTGEKPHSCNYCQRSFTRITHLKRHMLTHTGEKPYKCDICMMAFADKVILRNHLMIHTGEVIYKCGICNEGFKTVGALKNHKNVHYMENKCEVCNTLFTTNRSLKTHMKLLHNVLKQKEDQIQCSKCSLQFPNHIQLFKHMNDHNRENGCSCNICSASFSKLSDLNTHKKLVHSFKNKIKKEEKNQEIKRNLEKKFTCSKCSFQCLCKFELANHVRVHTEDRPHKCNLCGASFKQSVSLKRHMTTHTGEKPFECDICKSRFASKGNLSKHIFIHTGSVKKGLLKLSIKKSDVYKL